MIHYAYIALILAIIAFGKWYTGTIDEAGYNRCVASYESGLRKELNDQISENAALTEVNEKLVLDILNKKPVIETVYKTIEKKVNVYVADNAACNLTLGAVSLRNLAGDPEQLQPGYHPALSEAEASAASTISQRAAEEQVYQWGEQYNELSNRYQALLMVCDKNKERL